MPTPFNRGELEGQQWIAYLDLSGGRNTKKDPHALDRNQLAVSDNTWSAQGNTIGKRPGSISIQISAGQFGAVSAGSTGSGQAARGMVEGRFFDQTALVVQGANNWLYAAPMALPAISAGAPNAWVSIGQISGGTIAAAQLFDPAPTNANGPDGTLFIVDGIDTPKSWLGPGNVIAPLPTASLPLKTNAPGPITPKYVATLFSSLFYAGEPTDPTAVYVSNPFLPETFNINLITSTGVITSNSYIPAYIGRGDGVNGGYITGMAPLGGSMIIYKESSIYAFTQQSVLGNMVWGATIVSSSVGATAPRSIVAFDTFHVFLGIDGLYTYSESSPTANSATQKISENNPDLFDGPTAQILDRTTAIGVRYGNRYLIFFDNGGGTGAALGYPNVGAVFDFGKPDADGYPSVQTISGFAVDGVAPLRGPKDLGNFAWASATNDAIGVFNGILSGSTTPVYSDFGAAITSSIAGKADYFQDVYGDEATVAQKQVSEIDLLMSFPIVSASQSYIFNGTIEFDQLATQTSTGIPLALSVPGTAVVGTAVVGTAQLGALPNTPAYQFVPMFQGASGEGSIIQFSFTESSIYPWTSLGYNMLINRQRHVGVQSG